MLRNVYLHNQNTVLQYMCVGLSPLCGPWDAWAYRWELGEWQRCQIIARWRSALSLWLGQGFLLCFQEAGDSNQFCWRNLFSCINLLRILNKLTKWKHSRTMVCVFAWERGRDILTSYGAFHKSNLFEKPSNVLKVQLQQHSLYMKKRENSNF